MAVAAGMKRKRVVVNMEKKLEAIHRLDMGETLKSISAEFGVGDSTVSDWKKNRSQIEAYCRRMACKEALRERKVVGRTKNDALDEALLLWINQERECGKTVTGPLIQEKALSLHKLMGGNDAFMASPGWLDRFKKRNGIRHFTLSGECKPMAFVSRLDSLLEDLTPDQVYTCDHLVLRYRTLPGRSHGSGDKVTIMLCCNASGSHRLPPVVMGLEPRSSNANVLPVLYKEQSSCLSEPQLKEWFHEEFVHAVKTRHQEKACLLLNNVASQAELVSGDIRSLTFPHTVAVPMQPMHQGILKQMLLRCRHSLLSALVGRCLSEAKHLDELVTSLSIDDVVYTCSTVWDEMPESVLVNSWRQCWNFQDASSFIVKQEPSDADELDMASIIDLLHQLPDIDDVNEEDVRAWLGLEHELSQEPSSDTSDKEEKSSAPQISHEEGTKFLELAMMYVQQQPTSMVTDVMILKRLRDQAALRCNTVRSQETIKNCLPRCRRMSGPN
ncbi:hypothetical protein C0J52_03940 [Blattella germanica]|nr:hypothetical protein C0J52_03940 [Blattella germanica]